MNSSFELLTEDWEDIHDIVLFGFGKLARGNIDAIRKNFKILAIIDNDISINGMHYQGIPVYSLCEFIETKIKSKIVVVTSGSNYREIMKMLEAYKFEEFKDFCSYTIFCKDYFWNIKKKVFIGRLTFNLTTFCTLNCKNCTMLTPYNHYKKVFDLKYIINDIDLSFQFVDYVSNFIIAGGEPFLYKQLGEVITYVGKNYREAIGNIQIITNGTVEVSQELLNIIKKYNVEVRISDYTNNVNYSDRLNEFCSILESNKIKYIKFLQDVWLDMGFPDGKVVTGDTPDEIRKHMLNCAPNCQNVSGGKLYYCAQGWAADQTKLFCLNENDSLNLEILDRNDKGKEKFRKFYFGDLEDGYFSFCKVCRGWDTNITVPGGKQYEEGRSYDK